ncbi:hypothetical protein ANCDUO_04777, partial [Ancylostoma duodenale]
MVDTINIKEEYAKQFIRQNKTVKTYGLGYDHGSIMHYRQRRYISGHLLTSILGILSGTVEMCYVYGVVTVPQLRNEYKTRHRAQPANRRSYKCTLSVSMGIDDLM